MDILAVFMTLWSLREHGVGLAVALYFMLLPMPAFCIFQLIRVLLGLHPNTW